MLLYIKSQQTRVYCFIPLFKCTVVVLLSNFGLLEAVLWSHACPSVRLSVTSFSWNWLISFSEMLHNTKNRETEKIGRLNFFKKFLVCPKISSKRVQNRDFLSFLEFFFFFCWKYAKFKDLSILYFPVQTPYLEILLFTFHARSFSSSEIAGFFNHQYFWKESINK